MTGGFEYGRDALPLGVGDALEHGYEDRGYMHGEGALEGLLSESGDEAELTMVSLNDEQLERARQNVASCLVPEKPEDNKPSPLPRAEIDGRTGMIL